MARGPARAPTQNAFRGQVGATRTRTIHVTTPSGDLAVARVHVAVDVVTDPELGRRLLADDHDPQGALNAVRLGDGTVIRVDVPVVYHDPGNELFVLMLGEGDRHRELAERARLLTDLSSEPVAVPAYVRDFAVVFGVAGLRAYLERRAETALERARAAEGVREIESQRGQLESQRGQLERRRSELATREAEIERVRADVDRRALEIAAERDELDRRLAEAGRLRAELDRVRGELDRARAELDAVRTAMPPPLPSALQRPSDLVSGVAPGDRGETHGDEARGDEATGSSQSARQAGDHMADDLTPTTAPGPRPLGTPPRGVPETHDEITNRFELLALETTPPDLPSGADPVTTEQRDVPAAGADVWLDGLHAPGAPRAEPWAVTVDDVGVRLALHVKGTTAAALARGSLDLRLQLVRTSHGPLVALTVGWPHALRGVGPPIWATALLDPTQDSGRGVLAALARDFTITVDLLEGSRRVRRTVLNAPLTENAAYLLRAADAHRRALEADGAVLSAPEARAAVAAEGYDLLGRRHPEASEFRDDKLRQLATANQVRRAVAIARRFARPASEDYLVCVRGYPLSRWRELRRAVLERAVAWGVWIGAELAQVAVSEGLARSRKDLIQKMTAAFTAIVDDPVVGDLDADAAEDNRKALGDEAQALGMGAPASVRSRAIASELLPVVSGTIERAPAPVDPRARTNDELIALLDDRDHRLAAALELCERADGRAIRPVLQAVRRMGRADAVRVLGASVRFGEAAAPALTAGLASSKAFLRHGCALALALLRTDAGTEAVIDLLLHEPTEIWREVARAVGQVGPPALMPLASRYGRLVSGGGERATSGADERIAWAMAHVGVRGGKAAVEALASGVSKVAPVARTALELMAPAARDQVRVRPGSAANGETDPDGHDVREITVNRAFSRRFFEAADRGLPGVAVVELEAMEASGPMELPPELLGEAAAEIEDSDVIEASEVEAELDESDFLPT